MVSYPIDPFELKIEITRACNLRCNFCYLGTNWKWLKATHMPLDDVLRWIEWCVDNNVPGVRFTGGEATLHPEIETIVNYAHLRKRWVTLNTNGMADPALYDRLLINSLNVSVPTLDARRMDEITGCRNVLEKKLALMDRSLERGDRIVTMLTAMTPELIGTLHEFVTFLQSRPGIRWGPVRYESSEDTPRPLTRAQMQALAEEVDGLMQRYPEHVPGIGLATPFCSVTPKSLGARVFHGRMKCCGPSKALNVSFDGMLTACFGTCDLFREGSLEDVRNSPALRAHCTFEALPEECHRCEYLEQCAGGCHKPAALTGYEGRKIDYLAGFVPESNINP